MSCFYYNGYYSNEMGLIVEQKNIYSGPQMDFEMISAPGRDGDVILEHNRYKNAEVSYTVFFIGAKEKAAALRRWLCRSADYGYITYLPILKKVSYMVHCRFSYRSCIGNDLCGLYESGRSG